MAKITICGRLGKNPEVINKGCKFSLAENAYDFKNKEKMTHWFNVVAFGKTGENIMNYCRKGSWLLVYGRIEPWKTEDKSGFNIVAEDSRFVGDAQKTSEPKEVKETKEQTFSDDDIPW